MGLWESLSKWLVGKQQTKVEILCIGLDNSGKSTIMNHFKAKKYQRRDLAPTLGFAVEAFKYSGIEFTAFDMSGQGRYRDLWERYYDKCDAIIFVIDSSDHLRIPVAKEELSQILKHSSIQNNPKLPVLFFANKSDIRSSLSAAKCAQLLGLDDNRWEGNDLNDTSSNLRPWYICSSNAQTGEGLEDGIQWLSKKLIFLKEKFNKP